MTNHRVLAPRAGVIMDVQNCQVVTGSTDRLARRVTRLQSAALATVLCGTVALAGSAVSGLTGFDSLRIEKPNLTPVEDQRAASLSAKTETVSANTESVDAPEPTAINKTDTSDAGIISTAAGTTGSNRPESIVETAVAQSSQQLPTETPPVQMATRSEPDAVHTETGDAARPLETVDKCLVAEICIDQYLWSLYQRTPKRDTIKVEEQRKVTVKKKGKTRTVIEKFTKLVDEDFTWKDPKGRKSQHVIEGLRDRRHGLELQTEALSCSSGAGRGRALAGDNERIPRRLPSIARKRPKEGRV